MVRLVHLLAGFLSFLFAFQTVAIAQSPHMDWEKRQNADERLRAFGDDLFGDGIDPHTGSISFEHTDVSLPGNFALEVAIKRRRKQGMVYSRLEDVEFGDWELLTPRIYAVSADSNPWTGNRCSVPFATQFSPVQWGGQTNYSQGFEYSQGVFLDVPGYGAQTVLDNPQGGHWPAAATHVTSGNWYLTCGSASDGGQGFVAHSPTGDSYQFDRVIVHKAPSMGGGSGPRLHRSRYILAATQATDRNGNTVNYSYDALGRLTQISASDGRLITLSYTGELISSVTVNGRSWAYNYRQISFMDDEWGNYPYQAYPNQVLEKVTLPDSRFWEFDLDDMVARPAPSSGCNRSQYTLSVTHPSGAVGTFKIKDQDHRYVGQAFIATFGHCPLFEPGANGGNTPAPPPVVTKNTTAVISVIEKTISGPTIQTATWTYDYENDLSTSIPSANNRHNWTKVSGPGVHLTYFHNWVTEPFGGKLMTKETRASASGSILETLDTDYVIETAVGNSFTNLYSNAGDAVTPIRSSTSTTTRGSNIYQSAAFYNTNQSASDYSFGNPTRSERWSSANWSSAKRITETTYHHDVNDWVLGLPLTVTQNGKLMSENVYDPIGQLTESKPHGFTAYTIEYNSDGTVDYVEDVLLRRYMAANWKRGTPQNITRPDDTTTAQSVDDNGWVMSSTNALGDTTSYERDSMGRLTKFIPSKTQKQWSDTNISYNFPANISLPITQTISKGDAQTIVSYDRMFRPVRVETGGANVQSTFVETEYDALGRKVFTSFPSFSTGSANGTDFVYDGLGRIKSQTETVAPFAKTRYLYMSLHRKRVIDPEGEFTDHYLHGYSGPDSDEVYQTYKFDGADRIYTRTYSDIWGKPTHIRQWGPINGVNTGGSQYLQYDARDRLCRYRTSEGRNTYYAYDDAGQMTSYSKGMGYQNSSCKTPSGSSLVSLSYDDMGRVTLTDFNDSNTPDIAKVYDDNGQVLSVTRDGVDWAYSYDELGQLATETLSLDGRTYPMLHDYNVDSHLTQSVMGNGVDVDYTVDDLGRPTGVSIRNGSWPTPQTLAGNFNYHANGAIASMDYGNGQLYTQALDDRQLPSSIQSTSSNGTALAQSYSYNKRGQITHVYDAADIGNDRSYSYDGFSRLTTATGPWGNAAYSYDSRGNMLTKTIGSRTITNSYNTLNRLIESDDSGPLGTRIALYDGRGNIRRLGSQYFTYDMSDQPVAIAGTVSGYYVYDGNLKRVKSVMNGETIYNIYDSSGMLSMVDPLNGDDQYSYVRLGGQISARIKRHPAGLAAPEIEYQHTDHLGSPVAGTDATGSVAWRERYTPYGEKLLKPDALNNQASFTGHVFDEPTGLTYMQARYYDPNIGRFLSIDPVTFLDTGHPGYFNRYAYSMNDPINNIDPDGRACVPCAAWWIGNAVHKGYKSYKAVKKIKTTVQSIDKGRAAVSVAGGVVGATVLTETASDDAGTAGDDTTPEGREIRDHGKKGSGSKYIEGQGHTGESVDEIFGEGSESFDDGGHDNASGEAKTPTTVTVGPNGKDWARTNNETGQITQVNDRNNDRQPIPEPKE